MKSRVLTGVFLAFGLFFLPACSSETPQGQPVRFSTDAPENRGSLSFKAPEGWVEEEPSSSMRQSQYRLPDPQGDQEDAELAVFTFPGSGGSVEANLERWRGQFSDDSGSPAEATEVSEREINGLPVAILDVRGNYTASMGPMSGQSAEPQTGYRMLAAVIETPGDPWFVKLTGPESTVTHWETSFHTFLESLQVTGQGSDSD